MSDEGVQEKETEIAKGGGEETDPGNIIFRPNLHLIGIWGFNFTLGWSDISSRRVNPFICSNFRSPDHNESPQRGRERRERDVTPVYDSRTGTPNEPVASGNN